MIFVSQEGLLSSLANMTNLCLSRNSFKSYPVGGPQQFATVYVSITLLKAVLSVTVVGQ